MDIVQIVRTFTIYKVNDCNMKLTESQLKHLIAESVKKVLKENTALNVKSVMKQLDDKYYNRITGMIASYIKEYMNIAHPEMDESVVDGKINLWANTWYSELTRNLLDFEGISNDSFDSGEFVG